MPTEPLPDYFELLRQMTGLGAGVDAAGIDKKIDELRVVLVWLQVQANAAELSIKALEYQRDTLKAMRDGKAEMEKGGMGAEDLARFAAAFDPTQWLKNMIPPVQKPAAAKPAPAKKRKTDSARKKT